MGTWARPPDAIVLFSGGPLRAEPKMGKKRSAQAWEWFPSRSFYNRRSFLTFWPHAGGWFQGKEGLLGFRK